MLTHSLPRNHKRYTKMNFVASKAYSVHEEWRTSKLTAVIRSAMLIQCRTFYLHNLIRTRAILVCFAFHEVLVPGLRRALGGCL